MKTSKKIIKTILIKKNKIAAYGASARSSTLINYCGFNSNQIKLIFDKT